MERGCRRTHVFNLSLLTILVLCLGESCRGQNTTAVLRLSVLEEQVPDTEVGRVSQAPELAQALSSLRGEIIRYSLLDEGYPFSHLFRLHNTSGLLTTNSTLDREQLCQFSATCVLQLEVVIQSVTTIQFFRKQRVDVDVRDVNDHAPTFPLPVVPLALSEGDAVGTTWALDGALDRDVGENAALSYSLQPDSGHFTLHVARWLDGSFKLELALTQPLDRETKARYNLTVVARDNGTPPREGRVTVNITVTDINDNPPRFVPAVYNVSVAETAQPGAHVVQLTAVDADSPENGITSFGFSPVVSRTVRLYFDINSTTGQVTVKRPLSAVQSNSFRLVAECMDRGLPPLMGQAEVVINVLDSTNSAPTVNLNLLFSGKVSEMAQKDTVVAHVEVRDRDTGINGIVRCLTNSDVVELRGLEETEYKVVLKQSLAGRAGTTYNVTLTCSDSGQPPLTRSVSFLMMVTAANDNAPSFTQQRYSVQIPEDVAVGSSVYTVTATDPDAGVYGTITYVIPDATVGFAVTSDGGVISVTRQLDRETTSQLEFAVMAVDGGERPRNSTCIVEIVVTDVNDQTPIFRSQSHDFSVSEGAVVGFLVGSVAADDLDSGDNGGLDYSVRHAAPTATSPPFNVTEAGELRIASPLDREKVDVYDLIVTATDRGKSPLSATARVRVVVLDVNDNAPTFLSPSTTNATLSFGLDVPVGTVLMKVSAEDRDTDRNGRVSYFLKSFESQTMLALNRLSGELTMTRRLSMDDLGVFTVVVSAQDQGEPQMSTNLTLIVTVANVNHSAAAVGEGGEGGGVNTTVVVSLGCLTGLVLVAVIITIVVIKVADKRKRQQKQRNYEASHVTMTPVDTSFPDLGDEGGKHESTSRQDAEVSFESCSGSHSTAGTGNSETRLVKHDSLDSGYQGKLAYSKPLAGHHVTLDDLHSDSSGEATASDSGRGGSEDDFHHQDRNSPFFRKDGGPPARVYPERRPPPPPPSFAGGWCQPLEIVSSNFTRAHSPQTFGVTFGKTESSDLERSSSSLSSRSLSHPRPPVLPRSSSHRHPQPPGKHVSFSSDVEMSGFPRRPSSHASRSYDSGEDGNSTTTSGSYTLTLEPTDNFHPRIRDALV